MSSEKVFKAHRCGTSFLVQCFSSGVCNVHFYSSFSLSSEVPTSEESSFPINPCLKRFLDKNYWLNRKKKLPEVDVLPSFESSYSSLSQMQPFKWNSNFNQVRFIRTDQNNTSKSLDFGYFQRTEGYMAVIPSAPSPSNISLAPSSICIASSSSSVAVESEQYVQTMDFCSELQKQASGYYLLLRRYHTNKW